MYIEQTSSTRHQPKSYLFSCMITVVSHNTDTKHGAQTCIQSPRAWGWCSRPCFVQPVKQGVEVHLLAALGDPLCDVQHLVPRVSHGDRLLDHFSVGMATHHMRPRMAHANSTWGHLWRLDCWRAAWWVTITCVVALWIALWRILRRASIGPFAWRWPERALT